MATSSSSCLSLESEWQQVSRTLLSILADLKNAIVYMVSVCTPISISSILLLYFLCFSNKLYRTLLSLLAYLCSAMVWSVSIFPRVSCSTSPFSNFSLYHSKGCKYSWYQCHLISHTVIFWPSPWPKNAIPRWYTGRKWHIPTASNRVLAVANRVLAVASRLPEG